MLAQSRHSGWDGVLERLRCDNRYKVMRGYATYAFAAAATFASSAAATAGLTFFPSFHRTRGGGARLRRPSRDRTRTTTRNGQERNGPKKKSILTMRVNRARDAVRDFNVKFRDNVF
jgi:hypothetical protein